MLKIAGVELEEISDIQKYLFIEKGLKGGVSYITLQDMLKQTTNT